MSQSVLKPSESEFCVSAVDLQQDSLWLSLTGKCLWGIFSAQTPRIPVYLMNAAERQAGITTSHFWILACLHVMSHTLQTP